MSDNTPELELPAGCRWIDPFPEIRPKRSFVSDSPTGDRLRIAYFRRGDEPALGARAWFGPGAEGPPGYAHGGAVAAVLDEALGAVAWMNGHRVVVARLTVDFRTLVALGIEATIEAWIAGIDGRKVTCRARMLNGDTLLAEAEGLLVMLRGVE